LLIIADRKFKVSKGNMKIAPVIPKKKRKSGYEIKPAIALIHPEKSKLKK